MACTCRGHASPENVEIYPPGSLPDPEKKYIPSPCTDCVVVMLAVRGADQHVLVVVPDTSES